MTGSLRETLARAVPRRAPSPPPPAAATLFDEALLGRLRQMSLLSGQIRTEGIVGAREIGLMKPSALFVNTARGKLVDQAALTDALAAGRIGAVALDVFAEEPLPLDDPLVALHDGAAERVTLTPHNASQSPWTWVRDSQELWLNVRRSLDGEPIRHLV